MIKQPEDISKMLLEDATHDLCQAFYSIQFLGYKKEQAREFILRVLDVAYKQPVFESLKEETKDGKEDQDV